MTDAPQHTHLIDGHYVATWIEPIIRYARDPKNPHRWHGAVNSRLPFLRDSGCVVQGIPAGGNIAAKPGEPNHEGAVYPKGAIDVSDPQGFKRPSLDGRGSTAEVGRGRRSRRHRSLLGDGAVSHDDRETWASVGLRDAP